MSVVKTYYTVVPCCESSGSAIHAYFNFPIGTANVNGTYKYNGPTITVNGITFTAGFCYTFSPVGISFADYDILPEFTEFSAVKACDSTLCYDCTSPLPVDVCFNLYSCDGDIIITNTDLTQYVNTFIGLDGFGEKCFYVSQTLVTTCASPDTQEVTPVETVCNCVCTCYQITGNPSSIYYVDCDGVEHTISGTAQICSLIPPVVTGGITGNIYSFGECKDGVCTDLCYKFTNCQSGESLVVSNTAQITQYFIDGSVVTLSGYDGCWTIDLSETCDCPVNVTILEVYTDCISCLPVIAYKFTNCTNSAIVKYSTDDFSAYVGEVVKLDCGECWIVSQINYNPPAVQPIVILTNFENCISCARTYYQLDDCANIENSIYTYTDLSANVNQSVKLQNCTTCWSVTLLENPSFEISSNAAEVIIESNFVDCVECNTTYTCKCSIAWPDINGTLSYIDCSGGTITLTNQDPNTQSEKVCVREWLIAREPIYYDDCVNTGSLISPVYSCPVPQYISRFIKPGYSTPTCDIEKYEKISCNSAEILYKMVLTVRYGISNCCDSPEDKWIIKKELIDLQSAFDSNYTCTPVQQCCTRTSTCNCGCKYQ